MSDLPRLRPSQWALLERFIAIEERMDSQHAEGDRTISVMFANGGPVIVRPGVADGGIDRGDLNALRSAGVFDIHGWHSTMAVFRISQVGLDMAAAHRRSGDQPTPEKLVAQYRDRRRWLAGRVAEVARWIVLALGVALVLWSFLSGSWIYAVIGVVGAIFGTPVTGVATWVHARLTDRIDRWLVGIFEPVPGDDPEEVTER